MNPRIKKRAEEAGLLYKQLGPSVETRYTKRKKRALETFANLVIEDCVRAVKASNPNEMIAVNAIRIYFGD